MMGRMWNHLTEKAIVEKNGLLSCVPILEFRLLYDNSSNRPRKPLCRMNELLMEEAVVGK